MRTEVLEECVVHSLHLEFMCPLCLVACFVRCVPVPDSTCVQLLATAPLFQRPSQRLTLQRVRIRVRSRWSHLPEGERRCD